LVGKFTSKLLYIRFEGNTDAWKRTLFELGVESLD
jgi:hypothetical protein